jgi:hypothetical protein
VTPARVKCGKKDKYRGRGAQKEKNALSRTKCAGRVPGTPLSTRCKGGNERDSRNASRDKMRLHRPPATVTSASALAATLLLLLLYVEPSSGLRRHRHRRDPDPDPQEDLYSQRLSPEQVQNQYKPEFTGCEEYKPEVEEGSVKGRKERTRERVKRDRIELCSNRKTAALAILTISALSDVRRSDASFALLQAEYLSTPTLKGIKIPFLLAPSLHLSRLGKVGLNQTARHRHSCPCPSGMSAT